ncbi:MAG TPA: hypothetical protein VGP72_20505 [Planctomycetota bacterium]|jgi:hypothetical protein
MAGIGRTGVAICGVLLAIVGLTSQAGTTHLLLNEHFNAHANGPEFIDAESMLAERLGAGWQTVPQDVVSRAITDGALSLPVGGAIDLPRSVPCGLLDFRGVADGVQITGGYGGTLILGGGQRSMQILFSALNQVFDEGLPRTKAGPSGVLSDFATVTLFEKTQPTSDMLSLFSSGSIQIKNDVKNCAWIAGDNAFGRKTVTATARVDDSLFLWFGINWPFADYNAHRDLKNKDRNWLENAQLHFDCKGGGQNTRLYLMIETGYGNPGPNAILENCSGMSLYHGSTERSSSQGPGVYWLRNCTNVHLGLRAINAFYPNNGGPKAPCPSHDLSIEGGSGNILHALRAWNYSEGATLVNTCPDLQAWMCGFEYEAEGLDSDGILRFAVTPSLEKPAPDLPEFEKAKPGFRARAEKILTDRKEPVTDTACKEIERLLLNGRYQFWPFNARDEQTFFFGQDDLTKAPDKLRNGRKLPPPPSMPATDAPRLRRPIAFTQAPEFGKALLDAGADPTGAKPSDDAFAQLMYSMPRDKVEEHLLATYQADAAFREAKSRQDAPGIKAATEKLNAAMGQLCPADPADKKGKRIAARPRLEIPPGTFLLTRPLVWVSATPAIWGAGPDKTVLKANGEFKVIEQHTKGALANLTIEGGRVGLAITGKDHDAGFAPTLQSYIAGQSYYNVTFRNQTFAGIHIGNDDPDIMGGAEHDQNRYVDLKFINTGDYGIYMNQNMLDKWLFLHGEFEGQRKSGISIKFNNLVHGAVIGTAFHNIQGPGIDILGGNPEIAYRPWGVMVDQCEFLECGNEKEAAVELGYGELMSFTRCRIETKTKTVFCGFRGSPQIVQDVTVDVKTATGKPAMMLRGVRQIITARANGHVCSKVKASGPVAFVNDANANNEQFVKTMKLRGKDTNINWDACPAAHEFKPSNGWTHPFVFYRCDFGGATYSYTLLNVDTDAGKVLQRIELGGLE